MPFSLTSHIQEIIFPTMCMMCAKEHSASTSNPFCVGCTVNMPYTNHFEKSPNTATPRLRGRIPTVHIACMLNFFNYSDVKLMMHKLKYEGRKDIGIQLGLMAGKKAKFSNFFKDIDLIVPIPLHKAKLLKRGYNQSAMIGEGVSIETGIPMREDVVIKHTYTKSQTKMSRVDRVKNVRSSFSLIDKENIRGMHILIVDDVLTTGATIEACGNHLLEASGVKLSVLSICLARH